MKVENSRKIPIPIVDTLATGRIFKIKDQSTKIKRNNQRFDARNIRSMLLSCNDFCVIDFFNLNPPIFEHHRHHDLHLTDLLRRDVKVA